jgi:hypothetical protein
VLKSIDVLIGLTVVLLALSMAVTVITQAVTTILNSRGRHLRRGLTDLLQQLDPALTADISKVVATHVLTHPLVSGSNIPLPADGKAGRFAAALHRVRSLAGRSRLGNVVHREEFTKLLMGLAAGQGSLRLEAEARASLAHALANNGITDPDGTLKSIRTLALQLERSAPELSNVARQNAAILLAAESDLVAKIHNWFDQTMDRTSQRFTASTRAITFAAAFIVALGLQVDTPLLVNRLAADDALRAAFVDEARALHADQEARRPAAAAIAGTAPVPVEAPATDPDAIARRYRAFLAANGIIRLPSAAGWWEGFRAASFPGMLVTALLLSLGAPFWYSTLGRLLQLRSVLAAKDDAQRRDRQSTDPPGAGPSPPAPGRPAAPPAAGERGDLAAIG